MVRVGNHDERVRNIQALTRVTLSQLRERDFLRELLDRTKELLSADTAAVLLLDADSSELVAAVTIGLDGELRQGWRVAAGAGFAGCVAAERSPVIVDRVDHSTGLSPILLARGIRSLLAVPLIADGNLIGIVHVGSLTYREFTAIDAELLQFAADRVAQVSYGEHSAAAVVQRSLLPPALPRVPGLETAARYVPGNGKTGGDWYDFFILPTGQPCAVIGDVAGCGVQAAATMGRLRTAVRCYALETHDPADVLSRLDWHVQHFEPDAVATVVCAVFGRDLKRVQISTAGHYAPVVAEPGHPAAPADVAADQLIGAFPVRRTATTISVAVGAALCFFTGGLVERRGKDIDEGLEELLRAVAAASPRANCAAVMHALVDDDTLHDDITVLTIRRTM